MFEQLISKYGSLIIITICLTIYWQSINASFVFDDIEAIVNNNDVISDNPIANIFTNDFWGTKITHSSSHKSYRPFTTLTFRLLRFISNYFNHVNQTPINPKLYHIANVILYCFVCLMLYNILNKLLLSLRTCDQLSSDAALNEKDVILRSRTNKTAYLVTLLFAVHPIHTESVCACVGLADLLSAFTGFIAIHVYLNYNTNISVKTYVNICFNNVMIIILCCIAMLFKEQGITFVGLCLIFDFISLADHSFTFEQISKKFLFFRIIFLTFGAILLVFIRLFIMEFDSPQFHKADNPSSFEDNFLIRILNYSYVYAINVWIMIHPLWLCFDWSMGCIPLIKSFFDYRILVVILFWSISALFLSLSLFHRDLYIRRQLQISLSFGIIPFIPSSNIFFRVGFVIAERALFLPIIGYLLIIVIGFNLLQNKYKDCSNILLIAIMLSTMLFALRSYHRSNDWKNEQQLFKSGLDVCPLNAKIHYNIAKIASDNGLKTEAIIGYRKAIKLNPEYDHAMNNLANILKDKGDLDEAKILLLNATKIRPSFAAAWMNLGIVQTAQKQYIDAELSYLNGIKHRHNYADCLYNLGNLYVEQKRYNDAFKAWRNATIIKPKLLSAWNNMILMLDNTGEYSKAQSIALEALKFHPNESSLHFNFANILGKDKKFNESEMHFKSAIALNPEKASYYSNLAVLYHRWKYYDKALINYKKALTLEPNSKHTKENLESLLKLM